TTPQLHGHTSSILALEIAPSPRNWLFSASADGTVRIWDTISLECLYVILVQGDDEEDSSVGDVFALRWQKETETLFIGCQNTSLRWCSLAKLPYSNRSRRVRGAKATDAIGRGARSRASGSDDEDEDNELDAISSPATAAAGASSSTSRSSAIPIPTPPLVRPHKFFDSDALRQSNNAATAQALGLSSSYPSRTSSFSGPPSPGPRTPPLSSRMGRYPSHQGSPGPSAPSPVLPAAPNIEAPPAMGADSQKPARTARYMQLGPSCVLPNAHYGYIYALALSSSPSMTSSTTPPLLASGSGDEDVKLWACPTPSSSTASSTSCLELVSTLPGSSTTSGGAVLSLATWGQTTLFAGKQDGGIDVWDLDTRALLRTLEGGHDDDVLCLVAQEGGEDEGDGATLISAGADGRVCRWDAGFRLTQRWNATQHQHGGAGSIQSCRNPLVLATFEARSGLPSASPSSTRRKRVLFYGHYDVITAPSTGGGGSGWRTASPWTLTGQDGYLYGRGVSDDKGPILAVASAIQRLHSRRNLEVDVVMLIEGEEESGSAGFRECLERHKGDIGEVDVVLLSNSYWLDEQTPCVTVGMRGVIKASVTVSKPTRRLGHSTSGSRCDAAGGGGGDGDDVHSGVQGGSLREPMLDLVRLLAHLSDGGQRVLVPGFYEDVASLSTGEIKEYEEIVQVLNENAEKEAGSKSDSSSPSVDSLMARWRYPSLSLHGITSSSASTIKPSSSNTIIPARATAHLSLRLVPNQSLSTVRNQLEQYLHERFDAAQIELTSSGIALPPPPGRNTLTVDVGHEAGWWVADSSSAYTSALRESIRQAWSSSDSPASSSNSPTLPLAIREGGSIPAVSILESFFSAPAVHLPMGQASDSAHLSDERIRLLNLLKGREIVMGWLGRVAAL
ncbi:Zn-dependent exopeptidase, partial [Jaminaea rosea]